MPPTDKDKTQQSSTDRTPDQSTRDLPNRDPSTGEKDENVKGGRMKQNID